MGYPTRLFSSPPADGVVCIICFDVLEDAVCTKECGHTFCEGCIAQALNMNDASTCPNCRVVVTGTNPNYNLRDLIDLMPIKCPQEECDWTGLVRDLRSHDGVCSFKGVTCTVVGCNHECKRKDMDEHNTSTQGVVMHMELRYEQKMRDMEQKYEEKVAAAERKMKKTVKELESNMRLDTNHIRYVNDCRGWFEHNRNDSGAEDHYSVFKLTRENDRGHQISGLLCKIIAQGAAYPMVVRYEAAYGPPTCKFPRGFFHLNVCPDGALRGEDFGWREETTLSDILLDVQQILLHPRPGLIRQQRAGDMFGETGTPAYQARAKKEAEKYPHVISEMIYSHPKAKDMLEDGESVEGALNRIEDTWITCATCKKWRMMPPNMQEEEIDALPDTWQCKDNRFDPARSTCQAEERGAVYMAAYYERRANRDEGGG